MTSSQLYAVAICWLIVSLAVLIALSAAEYQTTKTKMGLIIGAVFIPPAIIGSLGILTFFFIEHGAS